MVASDMTNVASATKTMGAFMPCRRLSANFKVEGFSPPISNASVGEKSSAIPPYERSKASELTFTEPRAGSFNSALPPENPRRTT